MARWRDEIEYVVQPGDDDRLLVGAIAEGPTRDLQGMRVGVDHPDRGAYAMRW